MNMHNTTTGATPAVATSLQFCTGWGQSDTHAAILSDGRKNPHKSAGTPYEAVTAKEIVKLVKTPPSMPKADAQWLIPSTYRCSDARSHDAQRENGEFWFLPLDVDKNNLPLEAVQRALDLVCGKCCWMIYSSRSATETDRKWRALVPLQGPISGADYEDTARAFYDLLQDATQGELIPDTALERPGQLIYLPNRGAFYDYKTVQGNRLELHEMHPIAKRTREIRTQRAKIEAEAKRRREERKIKAAANPGSTESIVEAFNAANTVADMLDGCGYIMSRNGRDYISPNSSSGSYAVRNYGEFWFSFSGSCNALDIGQRCSGGRIGDAFDLFVHYDHAGNFAAAVRAYAREIGQDYQSQKERAEKQALEALQAVQEKAKAEGKENAKTFFKRGSELHGLTVPAREWLVPDLIPMKTVTLLSGDGGTGKSLLALQLAIAASTGKRWLGQQVRSGVTLTISAEDDDDELHRRQFDIVRAQGDTLGALGQFCYKSLAGEDALLATLDPSGKLHPSPLYWQIDAAMAEEKPVLLVLDTSADLYPGNENDRAQVRQFIGLLKRLALKYNCAVVLLSHPSLTGMVSGSGLSGSTAWNNSVRSRLYFERVLIKDGLQTIEDNPDRRVLTSKKANYGRTGSELHVTWQEGVFVADQAASGLDVMAQNARADRVFLKLLDEFAKQGRFVKSANGAGYAPKAFAGSGQAEGLSKQALHAAMERLFAKGEIVEVLGGDGPPSRQSKRIVRA